MAKKRYTGTEIHNAQPLYFSKDVQDALGIKKSLIVPTKSNSYLVELRSGGILGLMDEYVSFEIISPTEFGGKVVYQNKQQLLQKLGIRSIFE